jgi:FKBP-type peptidyl-prolyl cis-trans isomerase 2
MTDTATPSLEDCKQAVEAHLATTKSLSIDTKKKITKDTDIVVDYVGRLADGTVFDTSVESVAKACGLYTSQRDYNEGLAFTAGAGQMIAGFDAGVIGMSVNETKTVTIASKDAYGAATVSFPIDQLPTKPDGSTYKAGDSITTMNGEVKIETLTDKEFSIKNNHPLAGKDLIFDITIKTIK